MFVYSMIIAGPHSTHGPHKTWSSTVSLHAANLLTDDLLHFKPYNWIGLASI